MYQCCIFDLDGTIINTLHSLAHSISMTMEYFGYGPVDEAHTKLFVGDGYKKLVERALLYSGDESLIHYQDALVVYEDIFKKNCLYQVEPFQGMEELLKFLKAKEIKIGVLTNKSHEQAVECVESVYGKGFFGQIIGEGNGIKCKPDPSGAILMAEQFHVRPCECLYFGDTNTDMETGIAAGMDMVAVTWGFRGRAELEAYHPKFIVDHPDQIKFIFE